jgi:hypothetical protein
LRAIGDNNNKKKKRVLTSFFNIALSASLMASLKSIFRGFGIGPSPAAPRPRLPVLKIFKGNIAL